MPGKPSHLPHDDRRRRRLYRVRYAVSSRVYYRRNRPPGAIVDAMRNCYDACKRT